MSLNSPHRSQIQWYGLIFLNNYSDAAHIHQNCTNITFGIELIPEVDILKTQHSFIFGIAVYSQISLSANHAGGMTVNRTALDKISFRGFFDGMTSPPIAAFIKKIIEQLTIAYLGFPSKKRTSFSSLVGSEISSPSIRAIYAPSATCKQRFNV